MIILVQGILVPLVCTALAFTLARPGQITCTDPPGNFSAPAECEVVEENLMWYLLLLPAGASAALLSITAYRERGPGGVLEKRGYKVGCLGITARQDGA